MKEGATPANSAFSDVSCVGVFDAGFDDARCGRALSEHVQGDPRLRIDEARGRHNGTLFLALLES